MRIPISVEDRWYPDKARPTVLPPKVGDLIAWDHSAWRVIDVSPVPLDKWTDDDHRWVQQIKPAHRRAAEPVMVVVRPVAVTGDDPRSRDHDKHLRHRHGATWYIYPDAHYPVCASCGDPTPCREMSAQRIAEGAMAHMSRYETAGVCPACREPVTSRQKSLTFSENLEVLGGPPVTFHVGRYGCRYSAAKYETRWVAADPNRRRATLSCLGHVTNHNDGTYDCTQLAECPGPVAHHPSYATCRCPDCHARGSFGCHPKPNATLNLRQAGL